MGWRSVLIPLGLLLPVLTGGSVHAAADFDVVTRLPEPGSYVLVDTRPLAQCETATIKDARCLPARELFGQGGRLAEFSSIRWLFGAMGIEGGEHVVVAGRPGNPDREVVAAILYLAGQTRVSILAPPLRVGERGQSGIVRGAAREVVFTAPMRDRLAVTHGELTAAIQGGRGPALIDGRPEKEFWGDRNRAVRGGHIPGAESLPLASLLSPAVRPTVILPVDPDPVVYGNDPEESLTLFAHLVARQELSARVYLDGWARWASDGSLPAGAASHGPPGQDGEPEQ